MHKNTKERFELVYKTETRYYEDLKKKYDDATSKKNEIDRLIAIHTRQLEKAQTQLFSLIDEARGCLNKQEMIALKSNPLTQVDYIQLLIESEKSQAKPGWQDRLKYLMKTKDKALLVAMVSDIDKHKAEVEEETKKGH